MIRQKIKKTIKELTGIEAKVERQNNTEYGDYSTNLAMVFAKNFKKNPIETANLLVEKIKKSDKDIFEKIEVAHPGFINFFISKEYFQNQIHEILKQGKDFGKNSLLKDKVNVEFISANPTGPLTLGNGRGGFCGDVLANILEKSGCRVTREYYINDVGEQIKKLGHSVIGDSNAVYKGDYIYQLRNEIKEKDPEKAGEQASKYVLKKMIKPTVKKMGINFDVWSSEKELYKKNEVEKALNSLLRKKLAYRKDNALWFKSSFFGDDKDRVLVKSNGQFTYLASDIAYLKNKINRGFDKLIYFWGADHHGYVKRIESAGRSFGLDSEKIAIIVMQLVRLFEGNKEIRMSKRAGKYFTIDKLIDEVGLDVARFFFLTKSPETHLNFDLRLAKEQSEKNPVYYLQYAYARISSILRKTKDEKNLSTAKNKKQQIDYKLLSHSSELRVIRQLIGFPEVIEDIGKDYQVQKLPQYSIDLAADFHRFYSSCQVLTRDQGLRNARINLALATKTVLKNSFDLMGISSPEKM